MAKQQSNQAFQRELAKWNKYLSRHRRHNYIRTYSWCYSDGRKPFLTSDTDVFLAPPFDGGKLAYVTSAGVTIVPPDVLGSTNRIQAPPDSRPISVVKLSEQEYKRAWKRFDQAFRQHLPCIETEQWLITTWTFAYPLVSKMLTRPLLHLSGFRTETQRSIADLLNALLYDNLMECRVGNRELLRRTCQLPVVVHIRNGKGFNASDYQNAKHQLGDAGMDEMWAPKHGFWKLEKTNCQLMTMGYFENDDASMTSRTLFAFHEVDGISHWDRSSVALLRPDFYAAHLELISRVMRRIGTAEAAALHSRLVKHIGNVPKKRQTDALVVMHFILEELALALDLDLDVWTIVTSWLAEPESVQKAH